MTDQADPIEGELIILAEHYEGENLGGRPRLYETPAQFDESVNAYYQRVTETHGEPLTLTGLVLSMGFSCISAFENYRAYEGFLDSVMRAKTLVMYGYEKNVLTTKNSAAARILGAMDSHRFNPATKLEQSDGETHEDRLQHLR